MAVEDSKSDSRRQVEALERVNAELATEIRSLSLGRVEQPRGGMIPAARRLARLVEERSSLAAELEAARGRLAEFEQSEPALRSQVHEQHLHIEQLTAEVASLRNGVAGVLRRLRARLLRRQRG
ncbi:MAG: hypothetical protein WA862_05190 [Solirubrobacterales bacterium]